MKSLVCVVLASVLLFVAVSHVSGFQCYDCAGKGACLDTFDEDKGTKVDCGDKVTECVKIITPNKDNDTDSIVRGCNEGQLKAICDQVKDFCHTCDDDLCNSASTYAMSGLLVFLTVFLTKMLAN